MTQTVKRRDGREQIILIHLTTLGREAARAAARIHDAVMTSSPARW